MKFLNRDDLRARGIKFSRQHLHRLVKAREFPSPVNIGENTLAWIEDEIEAWPAARIAKPDAGAGVADRPLAQHAHAAAATA